MFTTDYKIYPEVGLIYYRVEGKTELAKIIELYDRVSNDPSYDPSYKGVGDWRLAEPNLTREEVIELSSYAKENNLSQAPWVALVESPLVTARSQIYAKMIACQHPLEVCTTVERASEILGIDLEPYIL